MNRTTVAALLTIIVVIAAIVAGCGSLPDNAPAKVGDVYLDNDQLIAQTDSYASEYGINQEGDPETYKLLQQDVLESLVTTQLAVQKADSLGVSVTDAEVQEKIDSIVTDFYGGDEAALEADLELEDMTLDDLRKQVKDYLLVGLVQKAITEDVAQPSDEEIAAYYEENQAGFVTEQTVDARHILIAVDRLAIGSAVTTTDTVTTATTEIVEVPQEPTTTTASTTTTTPSELAWARALATAAQVRADLLAGESWSRLAARYSDDPDTRNSGGDLGTVEQGSLSEVYGQAFDTALYSLELDQVSELVKTDNGYHIIQVTNITEPRQKSLEEARDEISALLLSNAKTDAWQKFIADAKSEIGVVYREDLAPTTTTTAPETTTTASE